jgi:hypothetical protein
MDAKMMENEAMIRANVRQYRDLKAISSNQGVAIIGKSGAHWLKGLNNALMLIIGRL